MEEIKKLVSHIKNLHGIENLSEIMGEEIGTACYQLFDSIEKAKPQQLQPTAASKSVCIHPLDDLRIIGGNISCLSCKAIWKRAN